MRKIGQVFFSRRGHLSGIEWMLLLLLLLLVPSSLLLLLEPRDEIATFGSVQKYVMMSIPLARMSPSYNYYSVITDHVAIIIRFF